MLIRQYDGLELDIDLDAICYIIVYYKHTKIVMKGLKLVINILNENASKLLEQYKGTVIYIKKPILC